MKSQRCRPRNGTQRRGTCRSTDRLFSSCDARLSSSAASASAAASCRRISSPLPA